MKKQKILIAFPTLHTPVTVQAQIVDVMGVHRGAYQDGPYWHVTHVPTGRLMARFSEERIALAFARQVLPIMRRHKGLFSLDDADEFQRRIRKPTNARVVAQIKRLRFQLGDLRP